MSDLIVVAAEHGSSLPFPAEVFGLIAAAIFALLLFVTMSFSSAAQRREVKTSHGHQATETDQAADTAGSGH